VIRGEIEGARASVSAADGARPRRAYWRSLIEQWRRSGVSQVEFCRRRGVRPGTFAFWKHTLARDGHGRALPVARPAAAPAFVPVRVSAGAAVNEAAPAATPVDASGEIEIVLDRRRRVRVRGPVDVRWLGGLIGMLETLAC
jgi:hypothetical protein